MKKRSLFLIILPLIIGCNLPGVSTGKVVFTQNETPLELKSLEGEIFHMYGHTLISHVIKFSFSVQEPPYTSESVYFSLSIDITDELDVGYAFQGPTKKITNKTYQGRLYYGNLNSYEGIFYSGDCEINVISNNGSRGIIEGTIPSITLKNKNGNGTDLIIKDLSFSSYILKDRCGIE